MMLAVCRVLAKFEMVFRVDCAVPLAVISADSVGVRFCLNWKSKFTSASWSPFWAGEWYVLNPKVVRISVCCVLLFLKSSMIWTLSSANSCRACSWMLRTICVAFRICFAASFPRCVSVVVAIWVFRFSKNGSAHVVRLACRWVLLAIALSIMVAAAVSISMSFTL